MKKISFNQFLLQSFTVLFFLLMSACSQEDLLEKKKLGELSSDSFFQTEDHAVWATNAVYNIMRDWEVHVFSYIGLTDIISDDADKGSIPNDGNFLQELDDFTFDASNIAFLTVWSGYFQGINRANNAITNIPLIEDMNPDLQDRLVGESRFLRAYFYFKLVRWFGDLPLIDHLLTEAEYQQPRVPVTQIYDFIIADLMAAIDALPEKSQYTSADLGRVTKGAAKGLLAKVYLTVGDFTNAERYALEVINSKEYDLFPSYVQLFQEVGENSSESLFEIQAAAYPQGGGGTQYNQVQGVRGTPNLGWGFNRPSDDFIAAFERGDPRREATILNVGEILPDGSARVEDNPAVFNERYNQKSWVPFHTGGLGNGPGNIRILRYAEVLLIAAEALNKNGKASEALVYLNNVRARARGQSTVILPDINVTNQTQLRNLIWQERRVELGMEQQRWFDLLRQSRVASIMQAVGKNFLTGKHELLPIPQSDVDLSAGFLLQNEGY